MFNPVSGKHSISKVIAVLHLPQEILIVQDLFNKLNHLPTISEKYQQRGITVTKTIQIDSNKVNVSNEATPNGFILEEFNQDGLTKNVLKLENVSRFSKAQLTFECNEYDRWDGFIDRLLEDVSVIHENSNLLIEAISLTYVDEFEWENSTDESLDLELLFKFGNDRSLDKLKHCYNGGLTTFTQSQYDARDGQSEEKTEIYLNKDINRISIVHTYAHRFAEIMMFDYENIKRDFNKEHGKNKEVLKELLTEDVLERIGITKN